MFKWKVSGLGGKKDKSKGQQQQTKLNNEPPSPTDGADIKNNNNNNNKSKDNKKDKSKDDPSASQSPKSRGFRLFASSGGAATTTDTGTGTLSKEAAMSRVGQRLAMSPQPPRNTAAAQQHQQQPQQRQQQMGFRLSSENLLEAGPEAMPPPLPPLKPEWRHHMRAANQHRQNSIEDSDAEDEDETEAIPNDSLYGTQETVVEAKAGGGSVAWRSERGRAGLADMAHWSSHGYLARDSGGDQDRSCAGPGLGHGLGRGQEPGQGYVVLRRQGDTVVTSRSPGLAAQQQQPSSLPPATSQPPAAAAPHENKYFSVRGYRDFTNKVEARLGPDTEQQQKYFSVDAKFLHQTAAADMKSKLREGLKTQQPPQYYQPPPPPGPAPAYPPYQRPPPPMTRQHSDLGRTSGQNQPPYQRPPPPARQNSDLKPPAASSSNLETSRAMSGSVSWLEWTQQLQAYIAWVNSQLRKRPGLAPVQDLRTDLQSGETLAHLIEIISGEKIAGIVSQPESLQGMRENLERVLQFMAAKKIRMHSISSREVLEGNLKAVMRLILALAAHYKPQSVKHHDVSYEETLAAAPDTDKDNETRAKEDRPLEAAVSVAPPPAVKRSPSLNESHYSGAAKARLGSLASDPASVFGALERRQQQQKQQPSVETQTPASVTAAARTAAVSPPASAAPARSSPRSFQREGSFTRTGSGRKLPQIPVQAERSRSSTLPSRRAEEEAREAQEAAHAQDTQLKVTEPEDGAADPRTGAKTSKPKALEFWESMENIERNDFRYNTIHRMSMGRRLLPKPPDAAAAGPTRSQSVDRSEAAAAHETAAQLSLNSSFSGPTSLPATQKSDGDSSASGGSAGHSPRSFHKIPADGASLQSAGSEGAEVLGLDCRREAEGSSTHNSPPTSVIQGEQLDQAAVWELGGKANQNPAYDWIRGSFDRSSDTGRRKWGLPSPVTAIGQEFNISDDLLKKMSASKEPKDKNIPYDVLLEDLSQAKRQLLELHNLECVSLEGSKLGLQTRLAEQEANISSLKQTLLRVTLAKQSLESEKNALLRRVEEMAAAGDSAQQDKLGGGGDPARAQQLYTEELRVARDAISNLRASFSEAAAEQHILDTLEQCVSVIVERQVAGQAGDSKPGSRMSGSEVSDAGSSSVATKIVYFTPRSVTPFMTSVMRPVGRITLRDFKQLFDRPGFYRYHFKTMDKEFGMVKEEIADDDKILPGVEGKIVVWVEEE